MLTVNLQDRTTTFSCDECPRTVVRRGIIPPRIVPVSPRFPDGRWYPLPRGWAYRRLTVWSEVAVWGPFRDFVPATRATIRLLEEEINELVRKAVARRRKHDPATYVRPKVAELTERVSDAILAKATFCGIPVTSLSAAEAHRVICHVWLQP